MENTETKANDVKTTAQNLTDNLSEYVQIYLKLGAVNATQKATVVATIALTATMLSVFCLFILFFAGFGIAIWLGESWGNMKAGYFTVAGFYIFATLLFAALRKKMIFPYVRDHMIRKVYE
ncbi:MAG TPA: phage holin family protein [Cyclobacteriaceae bacterium]|jgi:hypothetical protein|nr:phage holin family protein [Cyclobacteriaceae bacterium]